MPVACILPRLLGSLLAVSLSWGLARVADAAPPTMRERLASECMRSALIATSASPLTPESLEIASILAREAIELDPASPGLWRLTLDIAALAEDDELRLRATEAISRLDPSDEGVRLLRLTTALERYQTVDERVAATEQLLAEENLARLGKPVASRLALDLALLRQRVGDADGFSRWLARALELDRSNRTAAALAAGFYRANVKDAVGEAELLVNLVMADPTDVRTQLALAQLLLENGAYVGADRVYRLARQGFDALREKPTTELLADVAIAQWAAGDVDAALETIDRRQDEIDELFRAMQGSADRSLTTLDLSQLKGPVEPSLAASAAVILAERRDPTAPAALQTAIAAYEAMLPVLEKNNIQAPVRAGKHLEIAWIALWLGDDVNKAKEHLDAADKLEPLSDSARQRFEGWQALKQGGLDRAIEVLTPLAPTDSAARVGLALALRQQGRVKDAARELLALNSEQPGSMIGIWAAGELTRLLGQRVPLSPQAKELERLIASISPAFDRSAREPSMAVTLRVEAENPNPGPFDPIPVRITLTNTSELPLALDREGPLRPHVLVIPEFVSSIPLQGEIKPFVVNLDSRLRLMPHESVTGTFDLRWYSPGGVLNALSPAGAIVKLTVVCNFVATPVGAVVPGLYGLEATAPMIRVDGTRKDEQWFRRAINLLASIAASPAADPREAVMPLALISNELRLVAGDTDLDAETRDLILQSREPMPQTFARIDELAQAWVLTMTPNPAPAEQVLAIARQSESRYVRLAYMLFHLSGPDDPMLAAAFRGDDPVLRRLAELLQEGGFAEAAVPPPPPTTAPQTMPATAPDAAASGGDAPVGAMPAPATQPAPH